MRRFCLITRIWPDEIFGNDRTRGGLQIRECGYRLATSGTGLSGSISGDLAASAELKDVSLTRFLFKMVMKIRFGGLSRRQVVRGAACAVLLGLLACVGGTTNAGIFTMPWEQSRGPNPAFARHVVAYPTHERPGTIIVDPGSHFLYFIHDAAQAIRYASRLGKRLRGARLKHRARRGAMGCISK